MSSDSEEKPEAEEPGEEAEQPVPSADGAEGFPQREDPESDLDRLRASWQFAAFIAWCRVFKDPMRLKSFPAELFEEALLSPYSHQHFLEELFTKLLRQDVLAPYSEKEVDAWERMLHDRVAAKWDSTFGNNPLEQLSFFEVPPATRLEISYQLCEWRLEDCPVLRDIMKRTAEDPGLSTNALRHFPIGEDGRGAQYYWLSENAEDCRLYRSVPPRPPKPSKKKGTSKAHAAACSAAPESWGEPTWETVCTTLEEFTDFCDELSASRNRSDRALHDLLSENTLPKLVETANARRRAEEKARALEAMPRKRSSRIQQAVSKKEEDDKRKQQEVEERRQRREEAEKKRKEAEREFRLQARIAEQQAFAASLVPKRQEPEESREERAAKRAQKMAEAAAAEAAAAAAAARGRKREHSPGWSPLGPTVVKMRRTQSSRIKTSSFGKLVAAVRPLPPVPVRKLKAKPAPPAQKPKPAPPPPKPAPPPPKPEPLPVAPPAERKPRKPRAKPSRENVYVKPRHNYRGGAAGSGSGAGSAGGSPVAAQAQHQQHQGRRTVQGNAVYGTTRQSAALAQQQQQVMEQQMRQHFLVDKERQQHAQQQMQQAQMQMQQQAHMQQQQAHMQQQAQQQAHLQQQAHMRQQQAMQQLVNSLPPQQRMALQQLPEQQRAQYLMQMQAMQRQQQAMAQGVGLGSTMMPQAAMPGMMQWMPSPVMMPGAAASAIMPAPHLQSVAQQPAAAAQQQQALVQQFLARLSPEQRQQYLLMPPAQQQQVVQRFQQQQMAAARAAAAANAGSQQQMFGDGGSPQMQQNLAAVPAAAAAVPAQAAPQLFAPAPGSTAAQAGGGSGGGGSPSAPIANGSMHGLPLHQPAAAAANGIPAVADAVQPQQVSKPAPQPAVFQPVSTAQPAQLAPPPQQPQPQPSALGAVAAAAVPFPSPAAQGQQQQQQQQPPFAADTNGGAGG